MTDTTKIEKWAFPFKTAGASSAEVTDPQLYYDALANANSGFYPMGANGLWHGGVHFDAGTGALLEQSAVRCIADGEVIAYRIDEQYPISEYINEIPLIKRSPFSTGFVLVKHRLELPALPTAPTAPTPASAATPATATPTATPSTPAPAPVTSAPTAPAAEALTFYSLYMHLLDWAGYQAQTALARPEFWGEGLYQVKADAPDKVLGLNVREHHKVQNTDANYAKYENKLTTLPRGTTIETGEVAPSPNQNWRKLVRVTPAVAGLTENTGWVYILQAKKLEENRYLVTEKDSTDIPALEQIGLHVREAARVGSNVLAVLPHGTQVKISSEGAVGKYRKLIAIVSGSSVPALTPGEIGALPGFVWLDFLEAQSEPKDKGNVHLLPTPTPIKAGELIGHLGQYQNHDGAAQTLVHLEVFSCEDVPAFITKSQARAASLPDSEKTLVHVQPGTKLVTHTASMTAANPPTVRDPGIKIGVSRTIALAVLNNLPAERKIQTSTPMLGGAPVVTQWWRLDNAFADENGNLISGWLADVISTRENPTGTRHSPWEWLGFDYISETTSASEQLANHLAGQCLLSEAELPDYQMHISTADSGPIKTRLYDIIDGADGTVRDEKLSVAEIRAALSKPWHAQSISQLISQYESEWYWQDAKWDALDKLMEHTPTTPNTDWVAEKARIKTLAWWDKVEGQHGIKAGGMAWHFHVAGLVGNFNTTRVCQCNVLVKVTRWGVNYGPVVWGEGKLGGAPEWNTIEAAGQVTAFEKEIISVMCENEGKINSVHAYDSEIITAGAMQKTINSQGAGELPIQVNNFKNLYPDEYTKLFENQGWYLDLSSGEPKMHYQHPEFSGGQKLVAGELKNKLRSECDASTYGKIIQCRPVSVMACAVGSSPYIKLQIYDFIKRLRKVLLETPNTYDFTIGQLFLSTLGRATALDESVNRPANVVKNLKRALDKFFLQNPSISKDITTWGSNHAMHERKITDIYGPDRPGMTDPTDRYNKIKADLNAE
jgi:hypothetical protein